MNELLQPGKILLPDTICRICLTSCNDLISIFKKFVVETESHISPKTSAIMSVLELLEYFTQIQVYEMFSIFVCKICVKSAYDAFIFKTKVRTTEAWLHSNISNIKIVTSRQNKNCNKTSDSISLKNEDLEAIKTWLSKLETTQCNSKNNDERSLEYKTFLQEKETVNQNTVELAPECVDLKGQLNNKNVTIVKRIIRNPKTKLQSDGSKLKINRCEEKENSVKNIKKSEHLMNKNVLITDQPPDALSNLQNTTEKSLLSTKELKNNDNDDLDCQVIKKSTKVKNIKKSVNLVNKNVLITDQPASIFTHLKDTTQNALLSRKEVDINKTNRNLIELLPDCLRDHDYNFIFCYVCNEYFTGRFPYEQHKKIHTAKNHKCKYCTKKFRTFAFLKNHLKLHGGRKTSIDQLLSQYTLDINYPVYMNSKGEKFLMCELCVIVFKRFHNFSVHLNDTHVKADNKYCCSICTDSFNGQSDILNHLQSHTGGSPFFCAHCPKKYNKVMELTKHVKTHSIDEPLLTIPCDPKTLKNKKDCKPEDIPFLRDKIEKIYLCSYCGKKYKQRYEYKEHLRSHTGDDKALCPICGKMIRRLNLNVHLQTHSKLVPHKCNICGKAYKHSVGLKQHMTTHAGRKFHKCEICGKSYKEKYYLRFHMKYHNSERNHECFVCGNKYFRKAQLKLHFRTHTQERPYTCKYCDKSFRTNTNCKYHEYAHEGRKPFCCQICRVSFGRPSNLKQHIMRVHNKTDKK